jgi:bifunctional non-homologous end joining protein LigD
MPKAAGTRKRKTPAKRTQRTRKPSHAGERASTRTRERVNVRGIALSSPDRLVYPELGISKLELAHYYEAAGDWLLPHFRGRPLTVVRCPDDYRRCFYQKHIEDKPIYDKLQRVPFKERSGTGYYPSVDSIDGVLQLVQLGAVEFHAMGCRRDRLDEPDKFTIDLDPGPSVKWSRIVRAAQLVREMLREIGLTSFVKTTGGKGLHVVVPLQRRRGWDDVLEFTRALAGKLVEAAPREYTIAVAKAKRRDRILIDYLRNARGSIAVEAYSARARETASVSTPLDWDELTPSLKPESLNVRTVPKRLASLAADPWSGYATVRQSITSSMMARAGASVTSRSSTGRAARRGASRTRSSRE